MKKLGILSVVLLALVFSVVACGGGETKANSDPTVTFKFMATDTYDFVNVAGGFQGWSPNDPNWEMVDQDGVWVLEGLELDPGIYKFKYCPNGDWQIGNMEEYAEEIAVYQYGEEISIMYVDDGFGGKNAQITVK